MLWKVYNINTGRTIKAGFKTEDVAREWLESRTELQVTNYDIDEMDHDEEDEYLESRSEEDDEGLDEACIADEQESELQMSFDDDTDDDADRGLLHEFDPDDED